MIKRLVLVTLLLAAMAGVRNTAAYAAGLCVHPAGAGRCFTSIQAAVDAANDGDRITIRPGRYIEQVTISGKGLTLIGQGEAVVQAPSAMEDILSPVAGVEGRPVILVTGAEVTLRDLTIDGANSAEANPFLQGIAFINASGMIRRNLVKDVGFGEPRLPVNENGEPLYQGEGMLIVNLETNPRIVTIAENRVVNYNNSGITVFSQADFNDPSAANLTVHVVNNTVTGWGPNDVIDQWGIFFGGFGFTDPQASITGTLRGNRIRDIVTVSPYPLPGVGIATSTTYNVEMSDNVIENANIALAANQAFSARIANNQFTGPQPDVAGSTGILLSGSDSQVSLNRFRKFDIGILLYVEDTTFGSAFNTVLDENRFDNVAADVLTGPGALFSLSATARSAPTHTRLPR